MRRALTHVGLEGYALLLAWLQSLGGVRTDEAKYLLDIPYPHPPLLRFLMGSTEILPSQECLWRLIFASLLVQAVWIVWDMTRAFARRERIAIAAMWLLSGGLMLQAGSIMMAPLTALQALLFLWLLCRSDLAGRRPGYVALLWLASLFTAYQAVLFLPIVWVLLRKAAVPPWERLSYFLVPILLLALYTLSNPLTIASVVIHPGKDIASTFAERIPGTFRIWGVAGNVILSALGTIGIIRSRRWELLVSFAFVSAYIFLALYDYYAVLFLPLFIIGIVARPSVLRFPIASAGTTLALTAFSFWLAPLPTSPHPARVVMERLGLKEGALLFAGPFGHEWQYESRVPIRRYRPEFLEEAQAVVCLEPCEGIGQRAKWRHLPDVPVETWARND